ncbi:hypothetical protein [Nonomuraea soli]|uniref:Uncharacterized protein n=1 Tax=Nonomuraea soli TaxID=1032476 RepID=A0A7W0CCM6_9ACTN|nr:hypothetical protein [Nonomuraea soli]MBA2888690.1 hypothetical protein [Nonomuraea soli]
MDAVLFAIGTVVVISQLLAAFAGRPFDGFEPVFDWELGSWGWLGRAVFIAGWLGIIAQSLRPQSRAWDPRAR